MAAAMREAAVQLLTQYALPDQAVALEHAVLASCLQFCDEKNYTSSACNPRFQKLYANTVRKAAHIARLRPDMLSRQDCGLAVAREVLYPDVWKAAFDSHQHRMQYAYETKRVAKTHQYTCPLCKHCECDFYEMQCRSADESMTLFLSCLTCGHQWRIG